jgi:hypothetical protein
MKLEEWRLLVGTVADLVAGYVPTGVSALMRSRLQKSFQAESSNKNLMVPAADGGEHLIFQNKELMCRFLSLDIEEQKTFIGAVRKAMHDNQLMTINLKLNSSPNSRTVMIQMGTTAKTQIYGENVLYFSW